jgi:hypothetical protein
MAEGKKVTRNESAPVILSRMSRDDFAQQEVCAYTKYHNVEDANLQPL